jgi:DNA-binding transcriptional LysR family regulator
VEAKGSLDDLYVYAAVVDSLGFTAAARRLGLSTSAVSRTVRRLETRLGGPLLLRSTRALALTDLGRDVYEQCARIGEIARELDAISAGHARRPQGILRVSAPVSFGLTWLAPRLAAFGARWPEVTVDVTLTDSLVDLVTANCDVALRISRRIPEGLVARRLLEFRFVLVAAPDYLRLAGTPSRPEELQGHAMLCLAQSRYGHQLTFRRASEEVSLQARGSLRANNSGVLLQGAIDGCGIAIVPEWMAAGPLASGRVARVLADWKVGVPYEESSVQLVYLRTHRVPPKIRAFVDFLVAERPRAR